MAAARMQLSTFLIASLLVLVRAQPEVVPLTVSFNHGVASGDPLPNAMIIWTRLTPRNTRFYDEQLEDLAYNVTYLVADNANLTNPVQQGVFLTTGERDYTVKVDVQGLEPATRYYYGFQVGYSSSPVGTFRTPAAAGTPQEQVKYAIFTCSSWGWGYFNAYDYASQLDLDFWVHVGDWLYEYGTDNYPDAEEAVRFFEYPWGLQPPHEMINLRDYRQRHATYRLDKGLQAISAAAPLIANWDDHEHTNDPWADGAQNHQEDEGDWTIRSDSSVRAYHEWMPTRSGVYGQSGYIGKNIWRDFTFGDLATFISLEGRLTGRTRQFPEDATPPGSRVSEIVANLPPENWTATVEDELATIRADVDAIRNDPERHLIGDQQVAYVAEVVNNASTAWILVGQTTNLNDIINNYNIAIEQIRATAPETADVWEEALYNVTHENTTYISYSPTPHLLPIMGMTFNTTSDMVADWRTQVALNNYGIFSWFDPWHAHTVERTRFYEALSGAGGNAVVYGGDTHMAFAGMLTENNQTFGSEFNAPGVTSPDQEHYAVLPLDFMNAAIRAGNPNYLFAENKYKGFMYATLTREAHHLDFIAVSYGSQDYEASCNAAFDYAFTAEGQEPQNFTPSDCSTLPAPQPYSAGLFINPVGISTPLANIQMEDSLVSTFST